MTDEKLQAELSILLNCYSAENASNTPDFILANYLLGCLRAFEQATQQRETWYGRDGRPTEKDPQHDLVANAPKDSTVIYLDPELTEVCARLEAAGLKEGRDYRVVTGDPPV